MSSQDPVNQPVSALLGAEYEITVGDRVVIADPESWCQPLRKWGHAGRRGTVQSIYIPAGSRWPRYRVQFDMGRGAKTGSGVEHFNRRDIRLADGPKGQDGQLRDEPISTSGGDADGEQSQ